MLNWSQYKSCALFVLLPVAVVVLVALIVVSVIVRAVPVVIIVLGYTKL